MAQTIEEIVIGLKASFVGNAIIQSHYGLGPTPVFDDEFSKVSLESGLLYFIGVAIFSIQKLFDFHKEEVDLRAAQLKRGSTFWYADIAKKYQHGDTLIFTGTDYDYSAINPTLQIVKMSVALDTGKKVILKVGKLDGGGNIVPLSGPEKTGFDAYVLKRKIAGVKVLSISRVPDLLKFYAHIYVDPSILDATTGALVTNPTVFPVSDAVKAYIKAPDFNGVFNITQLIDKIQQVNGVLNPVFDNAQAKYGAQPYAAVIDHYTPDAGHLAIDPAFPLTTTITYIAS